MAKGDAVGVLNGELNRLEAGPTAFRLRGDPVCCANVRCRFGRARKGRCEAMLVRIGIAEDFGPRDWPRRCAVVVSTVKLRHSTRVKVLNHKRKVRHHPYVAILLGIGFLYRST